MLLVGRDADRPAADARGGAPAPPRDDGRRRVGLCFAFALLARWIGYSVALGAFLAGALVAESGAAKIIEHRIEPVRDVFAAVFFVSVGMLIDPRLVWEHLPAVLVLTVVVVVGKLIGVVDRGVPRRLRRAHVGAGRR